MNRFRIRPPFRSVLLMALLGGLCVSLVSCSTKDPEELRLKLKKKNERYENYNERRKLRLKARQERVDMWFDRIMN